MNAVDAEPATNVMDVRRDPGLQAERTMLAWRRTCLSYAVVSAVGTRLVFADLGILALVCGGVGLCSAAAGHLAAARRYQSGVVQRDGRPLLATMMVSLALVAMTTAWLVRQMHVL